MSENVSFIALTVWDIQSFKDISLNHDLLISYLGVFRTARDTPGLLKLRVITNFSMLFVLLLTTSILFKTLIKLITNLYITEP